MLVTVRRDLKVENLLLDDRMDVKIIGKLEALLLHEVSLTIQRHSNIEANDQEMFPPQSSSSAVPSC